ncbi:hypothetical protein [Sulfurospirillum multivorans]|nr:hypothetical protein [Sulfurospirillum multivorans]
MISNKQKNKFYSFLDWIGVIIVVVGLAYILFSKGGFLGGF